MEKKKTDEVSRFWAPVSGALISSQILSYCFIISFTIIKYINQIQLDLLI